MRAQPTRLRSLFVVLVLIGVAGKAIGGTYLGTLTWPEAEAALTSADAVIIPIGAGAKEHGPHLPMHTDRIVLEYLMAQAVDHANVVVVPPVLHGWFPAFRQFPGTEVADAKAFQHYVDEIAQSLLRHGARRLVFLNTGIFKATGLPLSVVARDIRANQGVPTLVLSWDDLETAEVAEYTQQKRGGHADEIETSIMLYLRPELVHMDRAKADYRGENKPQIGYAPGMFRYDPQNSAASEPGLFGDPTLATPEKGRRTLAIMTRNLLCALEQFSEEADAAHCKQ